MEAPYYAEMEMAAPQSGGPERLVSYDANLQTVWAQTEGEFPSSTAGDAAFVQAAANMAYRYVNLVNSQSFALTSISPTTGAAASPFTLTLTGTGFDASAHAVFNGRDVPRDSVNPTQIVCEVDATFALVAGTYPVQVRNGDGTMSSATIDFTAS
jgi:hypothetical protein